MKDKSETKPTHAPTPWDMKLGEDGFDVLGADGNIVMETMNPDSMEIANAAFIVKAVNCHDELLRSLKYLVAGIDQGNGFVPGDIRKALAKAEGKE